VYREELRALIAIKAAEEKVAYARSPKPSAAPVVDILDALKKSIAKRKPAASEQSGRVLPQRRSQR